mgnify:CR=1 FL=1
MRTPTRRLIVLLFVIVALALTAVAGPGRIPAAAQEFKVGFILVGPLNDRGWSQAHYEAAEYVERLIPGVTKIVFDRLNPADNPNITLEQVVESMVSQGAGLIFTTSDEFGPDTLAVASSFPDVIFMHVSGDAVLRGDAPPNVGNVMGRMEYMKMVAGCAAALETQTNRIAYLGPLINDETRRLAVSAYLGARYCMQQYRGIDPAEMVFEVNWIGFWFNIPGVTLDPTEVANTFINNGADVIISGIDTTEGTVVASQRTDRGERVLAVPYDYEGACDVAPSVCLGVPYFNWGPAYLEIVQSVLDGTWEQAWDWNGPDWEDLNNRDTTAVGFEFGPALSEESRATLLEFKAGLGNGSINLFSGPLNFQDGSPFLAWGQIATDEQVWYMPQLLEGMLGASTD